jgi:hypothetical protein
LNRPDATKETIDADGFLHTGDIAKVDREGYYFIIDRAKELIKYKGTTSSAINTAVPVAWHSVSTHGTNTQLSQSGQASRCHRQNWKRSCWTTRPSLMWPSWAFPTPTLARYACAVCCVPWCVCGC